MGKDILIIPSSSANPQIQFSGSADNSIHLEVLPSGSISFESRGSGSLFSLVDTLSGSLMSVNDISGLPILEVFSNDKVVAGAFNKDTLVVIDNRVKLGSSDTSGSISLRGYTSITGSLNGTGNRSSRPISASNANFSASAEIAGYYLRVGGNLTCSIGTNAMQAIATNSEFDFFQTSSAGNMLFETASGVTLNTRDGSLKLADQFSSATLKKVDTDEWDLIGDLI